MNVENCMSFRNDLARRGNLNRIMEMNAEGMGLNAISGVFRDQGIEILPSDVATIIRTYVPLGAKPLSKAVVRAQINGARLGFNLA